MTTPINKRGARAGKKSAPGISRFGEKLVSWSITAGRLKTVLYFSLVAMAFAVLIYRQCIMPMDRETDALRAQLAAQRKQNTIARMVQETRPAFLNEFRRVVNDYATARSLLPGEAEVSNVMAAVQEMAKSSGVRIIMFDASHPGVKSSAQAVAVQPPAVTPEGQSTDHSQEPPGTRQVALNERVNQAQIVGNHRGVANFLSAVARYPRIIYVKDFSITSLGRQESVNMTLASYDAPSSGILPPLPIPIRKEFQEIHTAHAFSK